jgi:kumamolisin
MVSLTGSMRSGLYLSQRLARLPVARQLPITISMKVRDTAALSRLLADLYNPSSPSYRHFLTEAQFVQRFAPTAAFRAGAVSWLESRGFTYLGTSVNGLQIKVRGSIGAIQKTLGPSLYSFERNGQTFFANSSPVRLPENLAAGVASVSGLTTAAQQHLAAVTRVQASLTPPGYSPSDLATLYDLSPLASQGITGSGQTIAILTFGDYSSADITSFDRQYGLSGSVTRVNVDGGASLGSKNGQDETEADIEVVRGTADGAGILVYEASNSSSSDQSIIDLYSRIVGDDRAKIVTTSWGTAESQLPASDIATLDQLLQEAAAQGQAFFAAAGDSGAYDNAGNGPGTDSTLAVDFPASDPWVTGVGGTALLGSGTRYAGETAWSDAANRVPTGGGGGLSSVFPLPSYQGGPGVTNQYSNGQRQVPDVAAEADPSVGYSVYTVDSANNPGWGAAGGTSMASPLWAAFAALVNQSVGGSMGFLNPSLYALGQKASTFAQSPFHDVTSGDNLFYPATAGWDFATGWGSFDGSAFVTDLKSLGASVPTGTPVATSTPIPPATSTPTSTKSSAAVTITKVILLHKVKGKLQQTASLKVGETGTLVILYKTANAGSLVTMGNVTVRENGQQLKKISLSRTTYQGKRALTATVKFTNKKLVGSLMTHITVTLGSVSAALTRTFKLGL